MRSHGHALCLNCLGRVRRRAVLGLGIAVVARLSAEPVRRIGILGDTPGAQWGAFRDAMRDLGYVEGSNVVMESRYSLGDSSRFSDLAAELIQNRIDVLVAEGGLATAAAKKATSSIPIVMTIVGDPVGVASLSSPGGNVTGSTSLAFDLTAKQLQLLKELMPSRTSCSSGNRRIVPRACDSTCRVGRSCPRNQGPNGRGAEHGRAGRYVSQIGLESPGGVLMLPSTTLDAQQSRTAALATRERLPALYNKSLFCKAGGLICYGAKYLDFRRAPRFRGPHLQGSKARKPPRSAADRLRPSCQPSDRKATRNHCS